MTATFKIIKNAPPVPRKSNGRKAVYDFAKMEIGDVFDAPRDMGRNANGVCKRQASISSCARGWAKKHNPSAKFTTRAIDENTVRCWRIA